MAPSLRDVVEHLPYNAPLTSNKNWIYHHNENCIKLKFFGLIENSAGTEDFKMVISGFLE